MTDVKEGNTLGNLNMDKIIWYHLQSHQNHGTSNLLPVNWMSFRWAAGVVPQLLVVSREVCYVYWIHPLLQGELEGSQLYTKLYEDAKSFFCSSVITDPE